MIDIIYYFCFIFLGGSAGVATPWLNHQEAGKKAYFAGLLFVLAFLAVCAAIGELKKHTNISELDTYIGVAFMVTAYVGGWFMYANTRR